MEKVREGIWAFRQMGLAGTGALGRLPSSASGMPPKRMEPSAARLEGKGLGCSAGYLTRSIPKRTTDTAYGVWMQLQRDNGGVDTF